MIVGELILFIFSLIGLGLLYFMSILVLKYSIRDGIKELGIPIFIFGLFIATYGLFESIQYYTGALNPIIEAIKSWWETEL